MKINWGAGIAIFYVSFMAVLVFFVVKSTTYDNSLVMENYYEQDLNYQEHYDKILNYQQLSQALEAIYVPQKQRIEFTFPPEIKNAKGTIHLFNPSSKYQDVIKPIALNENGKMELLTQELKQGRWKLKIDWKDGTKAYFHEITLML